jgi:AcrR family transcriptional regulator
MPDVKPKRSYRSPRRAAQAGETRGKALAAAQALFLAEGWTGTTIAAIARTAGISSETVYAVFGSKSALLRELIVNAVRGAAPETPLVAQPVPQQIAAESDQRRQIDLFAADISGVLERVAPLMDVARTAAAADAAMAALYARFHAGRRENLEWFAAALMRNGPLRGGLDAKGAAGLIWRLASPDLFLLIRRVEGLSRPAYAEWLADSLRQLLLDPPS